LAHISQFQVKNLKVNYLLPFRRGRAILAGFFPAARPLREQACNSLFVITVAFIFFYL
jgi:hypothetical protein